MIERAKLCGLSFRQQSINAVVMGKAAKSDYVPSSSVNSNLDTPVQTFQRIT
jgi:hypothetical protein